MALPGTLGHGRPRQGHGRGRCRDHQPMALALLGAWLWRLRLGRWWGLFGLRRRSNEWDGEFPLNSIPVLPQSGQQACGQGRETVGVQQ